MSDLPIESVKIEKAGKQLIGRQESVAVAESVTAGLLQLALSSGKNAMRYFQGGITAYNLGQKTRHLEVDPIHALDCSCVSERVADQMAHAACRFFSSEWGIAVTGFASPVPESDDEVFAYFSIVYRQKTLALERLKGSGSCAYDNQLLYADRVLQKFADLVAAQ